MCIRFSQWTRWCMATMVVALECLKHVTKPEMKYPHTITACILKREVGSHEPTCSPCLAAPCLRCHHRAGSIEQFCDCLQFPPDCRYESEGCWARQPKRAIRYDKVLCPIASSPSLRASLLHVPSATVLPQRGMYHPSSHSRSNSECETCGLYY